MTWKRREFVSIAVVLALAAAPGLARTDESSQDPCVADLERLCPDVQPGRGKGVACLRENRPRLSDACRAKLEVDEARVRAMIGQFSRACRADVGQFCADVEKGNGRVFDCLDTHSVELSTSCQAEITKVSLARTQVQAVTAACRADIGRLCQGVPRQASAILQCLQAHESELSPDCTTVGPAGR
jgi:Golgi apparatus protein 1